MGYYNRLRNDLGEILTSARTTRRFTQQELADRLEVAQSYISDIEKGKRNITVQQLSKYLTALNFGLDIKLKPLFESDEEEKIKMKVWKVLGIIE